MITKVPGNLSLVETVMIFDHFSIKYSGQTKYPWHDRWRIRLYVDGVADSTGPDLPACDANRVLTCGSEKIYCMYLAICNIYKLLRLVNDVRPCMTLFLASVTLITRKF